nr:putative proline-tRNA ligase [Ipomoea batatas]
MIQAGKITLLLSAEAAVPRLSGSTESRVSMSAKAERGTSLNVSVIRRLSKLSKKPTTSVVPGMIGFPANNSAMMQPTLHISIATPYAVAPSKSSGALYHRVTTRLVNGCCFWSG